MDQKSAASTFLAYIGCLDGQQARSYNSETRSNPAFTITPENSCMGIIRSIYSSKVFPAFDCGLDDLDLTSTRVENKKHRRGGKKKQESNNALIGRG
jgi:hypothetical protein